MTDRSLLVVAALAVALTGAALAQAPFAADRAAIAAGTAAERTREMSCWGLSSCHRRLAPMTQATVALSLISVDTGDGAFRQHEFGHTPAPDWPYFIVFADKELTVQK